MRQSLIALMIVGFLVVVCCLGATNAQTPIEDTGLTATTPRPDPDLVVVREKSYGAGGIDLTTYGIGAGPVDYVQSLYFRFFVDNNLNEDATAGRVILPPGAVVLGFIVDGADLGGSVDDMVATATDALFGITDPDTYSENARGFGVGGGNSKEEFVCATAPDRFVFGLNVTDGVDDFRAIIDYGNSFPPGLTMDIASYDLGSLGGVPVERGFHIGDTSGGVPGANDYGEFGSLLGVPLTASSEPTIQFDAPFLPLQSVYIIRNTSGMTRIDAFDVVEQLPWPSRAVLDVRVQNPAGMTDGPDGLLHAIGFGGGYASTDPSTGNNTQLLLEDRSGDNVDLTDLPGTRDLYVVRNTTGDTAIDRLDIDNPSFAPAFTILALNLPDPVAITDAANGLVYVLGSAGTLVPVDPVTGPLTPINFAAPIGNYVSSTGVPSAQVVYMLRDSGTSASVDRFDIGTAMVTFDFAVLASMDDAISITDAPGGRLALIGTGQGDTPPQYVELDAATGAELASNLCLEFSGSNVSIAGISASSPATPGEPGIEDRPLLVTDYDSVTGELSIIYGIACESAGNTIHFGTLSNADLAAYNYTGRDCGIGNTGTYENFAPGSGSYFFTLVAHDGVVEGSYGTSLDAGVPAERPADSANPTCPLPQDLTNTCTP